MSRYAVYTVDVTAHDEDGRGMPGRLEAVVEADTPAAAIRSHLAELGYRDDAEDVAAGLVAVEVTDPRITAGAVRHADHGRREVELVVEVGPETYHGTAQLARRRADGVWDAWGDDVRMWLSDELVEAVDAAEALDEGTRDIVLGEIVATARGAIRRHTDIAPRRVWRVSYDRRTYTPTGMALARVTTTVPASSPEEALELAGADLGATVEDTGSVVGVWRVNGIEVWAADAIDAELVAGAEGDVEVEPVTPVWEVRSRDGALGITYDHAEALALAAAASSPVEVVRL